uniref:RING-type E3 ubiquitin transferase n=1 Tax=Elaeis guineensis var. tenera TaxID=51953 RepID=A0A8N4F6K6_ELAGV|nr:uncharacterized protein LOC105050815 isoform X2 [Elaeis guineensis]
MDEFVVEKAAGGHDFSRKGSGIVFIDQNHEDRSIQDCDRLGCSTSLNSMKGTQIGDLEKARYVKATFCSASDKTIAGSSSKSLSSYSSYQKSFHERQKQTLQREKVKAESSNTQGNIGDSEGSNTQHFIDKSWELEDSECSKSNPTKVGIQMLLPDLPILERVSTNRSDSPGRCTIASSSKSHDQINHNFGSGNQTVSSRSFYRHSTYASRNFGNAASPAPQGLGIEAHKCGLKSLICTSVSDVLPSVSEFSRGANSAAKDEGTSGPSTGRYSGSTHTGISGLSRSLPEHRIHRQTLLNIRSRPSSRDEAASVRTRVTSTGDARTRLSEQGVGNTLPVHEPVVIAPPQQNQVSISDADLETSSRSTSTELPNVSLNSSEHRGSSSRTARSRMVSCPEDGSTNILQGSLGDRGSYRRFNMDRIDEVLLALERIERGEELTPEQLSVLETTLFSAGVSFSDRHRDMRMDIDNMSYEELLALEEKMGTVNTGLSKDQLSECLKRSLYTPASEVSGITGSGDDTKCSICQIGPGIWCFFHQLLIDLGTLR